MEQSVSYFKNIILTKKALSAVLLALLLSACSSVNRAIGPTLETPFVAAPTNLAFSSYTKGAPVLRDIAISNSDSKERGISIVKKPGTSDKFAIIEPISTKIAAGATINITIRFDPAAVTQAETYTGTIVISSDDSNEKTAEVPLTAAVMNRPAGPEIEVPELFSFSGYTNTRSEVRISITNIGTSLLSINSITLKPGSDDKFTITGIIPSSIDSYGASENVYVRFNAFAVANAGTHTAVLVIKSDDSDEGNLEIPLSVEIKIRPSGPEIYVSEPLTFSAYFNDFGSRQWFSIGNEGNSVLTISSITLKPSSSSPFVILGSIPTKIAPFSSKEVAVYFEPSSVTAGRYVDTVVINSDDSDEATVEVSLEAEVKSRSVGPEIEVTQELVFFAFTNAPQNSESILYISNIGDDELKISSIMLKSDSASEFSIFGIKPARLYSGRSEGIKILFVPGAVTNAGVYTGTVVIESDDSDERTVEVLLRAEVRNRGNAPPDVLVVPGSFTFSAYTNVGGTQTKTVTVRNVGYGALKVTNVILKQSNNSPLSLQAHPGDRTMAFLNQFTFSISFNSGTFPPGYYTNTVVVKSDDPDEGEVEIPLQAEIKSRPNSPEIELDSDRLDFSVYTNSSTEEKQITIRNLGAAALSVSSITLKDHDPAFTIGSITPPLNIAVGGSADVPIRFNPASIGQPGFRTGTVVINSDDSDEAAVEASLYAEVRIPEPKIYVAHNPIVFGSSDAQMDLFIQNNGHRTLIISNIMLKSGGSGRFMIDAGTIPDTLGVSEFANVTIRFDRNSAQVGTYHGIVVIESDDPSFPIVESLIQATIN